MCFFSPDPIEFIVLWCMCASIFCVAVNELNIEYTNVFVRKNKRMILKIPNDSV